MKALINKLLKTERGTGLAEKLSDQEQLKRQVSALYGILSGIYGPDKLVLKAGKLDALNLMRSEDLSERVLALQKLVFEDPTIDEVPEPGKIEEVIGEIEEEIADLVARRSVEDKIEKKVAERMQVKHEEYVNELKMQVLKEDGGPDNPQTLKKYAELEKLERKKLSKRAMEALRPTSLAEVVGQDRAIKALLSKIATPYPQHVILYGPPGVGKTTVARLALERAKQLKYTPFDSDAPFVEVDGTTLRWDPREVSNPLLGSVHDPIYQGAKRDLAEGGVPEPKLGLVTEAHGGVLFIDEIGELEPLLLNKLLKVLEDRRVTFDSAYYDPSDPHVPKYIRKLFEEGAPADFVLIGATTKDPDSLNPAIRSRCAEVFFEPLTQRDIKEIVERAAARLGAELEDGVADVISDYTIEGRKATSILADAFGIALYRTGAEGAAAEGAGAENGTAAGDGAATAGGTEGRVLVTREDVFEVIRTGRLSPFLVTKASDTCEVGKVFGLAVDGFIGSVLEIEAVVFPTREPGKGRLRFNETAGKMARDSVFNAAAVFRQVTGQDLADYDVHINVVGGGLVDGPSAGCAVLVALVSAATGKPVRQNVAVTGEVSIQGKVKPVGGVFEKIYGARQAGITKVLIPRLNAKDVPPALRGVEVVAVDDVQEVLAHVLAAPPEPASAA